MYVAVVIRIYAVLPNKDTNKQNAKENDTFWICHIYLQDKFRFKYFILNDRTSWGDEIGVEQEV